MSARDVGVARRRLLLAGLALVASPAIAQQQCRRTPDDGLGPFYRPNQPAQTDLCIRPNMGERLQVSGRVLRFPDCRPVPGATVEVWQADGKGGYSRVSSAREDDLACLLRGTLRAGDDGVYRFETLMPGRYPRRPPHIHFRVSADGHRTLVTQMYFPDEKGIDPRQLARMGPAGAQFDIVIAPL